MHYSEWSGRCTLKKRCPFELAWIIFWEEDEESLKSYSFILIVDRIEKERNITYQKKIEEERNMRTFEKY